MTTEVGFYHCTRTPAAEVAVRLAAKAFDSGERMLLLADGAEALPMLDRLLWTFDPDGFLPHARTGTLDDSRQPLLLAPAAGAVARAENGARFLLLLETGLPAGFEAFARVFLLFEDGGAAQQRARLDWKALADHGDVARSYWQQEEGRGWQKRDG